MHIFTTMCYGQTRMLRALNHAGLFQAATCFDIHVASILTPRWFFKEQFCDADASMLSIMQTLQNPCQAKGLCKASPKGSLTLCYILGTAAMCHNSDRLGFHAVTSTQSTLLTCRLRTAFGCRRAHNLAATDDVVDVGHNAECTATQ